jgi:hypothetical protein
MRGTRLGVVLSAALVLASCGEQAPTTGVVPHVSMQASSSAPACPTVRTVVAEIIALFARGNQSAAMSRFNAAALVLGSTPPVVHTAIGRKLTFDLIAFVLKEYFEGELNGGFSSSTQTQVVTLVNGLLCWLGLPQTFTLASLGTDGAAAVITPSSPDTTIVTGSKFAGTRVDSGSVTQPVLVTIKRLPDSPGPLHTQLDQYPIYYEFSVTPDTGSFVLPVTIGVCLASSATPPDPTRLRVAHNVAPDTMGSIEILPLVPAPFLDCTDADVIGLRPSNPLANLALGGWRATRSALTALFSPERLMAATGGIGGTVKTFSPFGLVDTLVVMTPNSATSQHAPVGDTVPAAPSVKLATPLGHPFAHLAVSFAVTAGGGSLTGGSTTTDTDGVATTGPWALGLTPGLNTVTATAAPPHLHSGISGSPLAFDATALAPTQLVFTTQPSNAMAGSAIAPEVQVAVKDQLGEVVTSSSASVTVTLQPSGVTLGGTTTVNAVNGVASFTDLSVTKAGTGYTLVATSGGLTQATSTPFGVTNAPAATIQAVAGNNQTATAGSAVAVRPAVRVTDQYGNPVPGVSVTFVAQNGGTVTGALQTTDATGTATVGSWKLAVGTNYLLATAGAANVTGNPVTFTATGKTSYKKHVDCGKGDGDGDDLGRAFYHPRYPGRGLSQVDLYLSSNAAGSTPVPYTIQLTAKSGGFNGPVIGTSTVTVYLRGATSRNLPTHFVFPGTPAIRQYSTVTFQFNVLSNPSGAALSFNIGACGVGDTHCTSPCPIVETNDAGGTLSSFRREACGVAIIGN